MAHNNFNSIKVQLRHIFSYLPWEISQFQFHKGTIKTSVIFTRDKGSPYFNSIKVQLRPAYCAKYCCKQLFQFHKGTIKTLRLTNHLWLLLLFQFHKGTIKTMVRLILLTLSMDFNSIKVQLRQKIINMFNRAGIFQFHKGTIKTDFPLL